MLPYRNRSNSAPSWQYEIIWNMPIKKGCVACGANRIGKSQLGAFASSLMVTGEHPRYKSPAKGIGWLVAHESKKIAEVIQPQFERMIPKRYKDNGSWNGKLLRWVLKSDGREWEIWYKSGESGRKAFEGAKIDFAWVDEELKDTSIFPEIERGLIDNQGIWIMTATPVMGTKWLHDLLHRDDVKYTMAGMRENPYLPIDEIEKYARQLSKDERDVRVDGKYIIFGGRPVFDRDLLDEQESKIISFEEGVLV